MVLWGRCSASRLTFAAAAGLGAVGSCFEYIMQFERVTAIKMARLADEIYASLGCGGRSRTEERPLG